MFRCIVLSVCIASLLASPALRFEKKILPSSRNGRIIDGEPAKEGQFPWQVGLHTDTPMNSRFCGGTIISAEWILTSGSCLTDAIKARVIYGTLDSGSNETIDSTQLIIHSDYYSYRQVNDIGLIKLEKPLEFSDKVKAISLSSEEVVVNTTITVSGWGRITDRPNVLSPKLNFVQLQTIDQRTCERWYPFIEYGIICAWSGVNEVKSSCKEDKGGPAVINVETDPLFVGIVGFQSDAGCENGAPSGYTSIAYYRDWIKDNSGV